MKLIITILTEQVMQSVRTEATLNASKLMQSDRNAYERLATTAAEESAIVPFVEEATALLSERMKRYTPVCATGSEQTSVVLNAPTNISTNVSTSVRTAVGNYLCAYTIARWYELADKQEAAGKMAEAMQFLASALALMSIRIQPTRTTIQR